MARIMINEIQQNTIDNFCLHVIKSYVNYSTHTNTYGIDYKSIDINVLAWDFINFFQIEYPISRLQLLEICHNSKYKIKLLSDIHKPRGYHFLYNNEGMIFYKQNDAPCGQIYTLLHELYEIIEHNLLSYNINIGDTLKEETEIKANQFAAFVYAPDEAVASWINEFGLDVFGLKDGLKCSYATALIRMHDVLLKFPGKIPSRNLPIISILFERPYWNKKNRERIPWPQLKTYKKSKGFYFKLNKKEIKELHFHSRDGSNLSILKLIPLSLAVGYDFLLKDVEMEFRTYKLTVDILIRNVNWARYRFPVKVLIQLMPSKKKTLRELARNLNIKSIG
jgi:hypothetical protein